MKAISLKAHRATEIIAGIYRSAKSLIFAYGLHLAVIGTILALFGVAIESESVIYWGAAIGMAGILPEATEMKGGER